MRVDLYRRAENGGLFSYLAVPVGKLIPAEATNVDWETVALNIELQRSDPATTGITLEEADRQFIEKGYAISSLAHLKNGRH